MDGYVLYRYVSVTFFFFLDLRRGKKKKSMCRGRKNERGGMGWGMLKKKK